MRVTATDAELVFFHANNKSLHALFYNQAVDAPWLLFRIRLSNHQINTGCWSIGDPILGAIQHVVITHVHCGGLLRCRVGPCLWLTQAKGADLLTCSQLGQVFLLLLFIPVGFKAPTNQGVVHTHHHCCRGVYLGYLFHGKGVSHGIHAATAIVGWYHHAHQTQLAHFRNGLRGECLCVVSFDDSRQELCSSKISGSLLNHQVLFC